MNRSEWEILEKQEYAFLDTKDLLPFITKGKAVHDVMDEIEDKYEKEYLASHPNDQCLFNVIGDYEFADYIDARYKIRNYEYTELRFDK